MRLYRILGAAWAGTQADAKRLGAEHRVPWHETDVPTDKPTLLAWLNERNVPAKPEEAIALEAKRAPLAADPMDELEELEPGPMVAPWKPRVDGFCDSCGRSAAGALKLKEGNEIDTIGQWMETAELWALQRLVERVREAVAARGAALDGKGVQ